MKHDWKIGDHFINLNRKWIYHIIDIKQRVNSRIFTLNVINDPNGKSFKWSDIVFDSESIQYITPEEVFSRLLEE